MLTEKQRNALIDKLFSSDSLLREAAKTLYCDESEAYDLTKKELEIVLDGASDFEIDRLQTISESTKGSSDYSNGYGNNKSRRSREDYDDDSFPNGPSTSNIQKKQRRVKNADNPLVDDGECE